MQVRGAERELCDHRSDAVPDLEFKLGIMASSLYMLLQRPLDTTIMMFGEFRNSLENFGCVVILAQALFDLVLALWHFFRSVLTSCCQSVRQVLGVLA